jgi:hypothetical protein
MRAAAMTMKRYLAWALWAALCPSAWGLDLPVSCTAEDVPAEKLALAGTAGLPGALTVQ